MVCATCHCCAVRIEVPEAPTVVKECNCSICRRLGWRCAYYHPKDVAIIGATVPYIWGDKTCAFHHCPTCGCTTHWQNLDPNGDRMAINARLIDGLDWSKVRVRPFDGADTWTFLD